MIKHFIFILTGLMFFCASHIVFAGNLTKTTCMKGCCGFQDHKCKMSQKEKEKCEKKCDDGSRKQ